MTGFTTADKAAYYQWSRHWWAAYHAARYTPGWRSAFGQWIEEEQRDLYR